MKTSDRDEDSSIHFVSNESFIIAGIIGICTDSLIWGIVSFFSLLTLYALPILGGILSIVSSMIESYIIHTLLLKFLSIPLSWFIILFAFYLLMKLFRKKRLKVCTLFEEIKSDVVIKIVLWQNDNIFKNLIAKGNIRENVNKKTR